MAPGLGPRFLDDATAPNGLAAPICQDCSPKLWVIRDDGRVEGRKNEGEFYRQIIRRAEKARQRAAEALNRTRGFRRRRGDVGGQVDAAAPKRRRWRREDD